MGLFNQKYEELNAAQQQAVDTVDGPVLVVAGPGTGKTQLLSMRVANILKTTDVSPDNILCLTFTNKAALNMRDRLIKLTDGAGQGVMVKTFHSFAAEIMNMYPDQFWNGARLTTAPDTIQNEVIVGILKKLPLSDPLALKFAGSFTIVKDIQTALRLTKEAGLTPAKLKALIEANAAFLDVIEPQLVNILSAPLKHKELPALKARLESLSHQGIDTSLLPLRNLDEVISEQLVHAIEEDLKTTKTTQTGKIKSAFVQTVNGQKGMFKERERNQWWLSLANVYQQYRDELHARGYYDYSDMIIEVISIIEQNPEVKADIQEQFQYVLIDEFQDTNAAQMRLAHLVADHHANNGRPNLMAVGDDDQSIYKFNGAELANMLTFRKSYPDCKVIVLKENYRSSQAVLNLSAKIISQATDRLVTRDPSLSKNIIAAHEPSVSGKQEHFVYSTQDHQLADICAQIKDAYSNTTSAAVLARNTASLRRMATQLAQVGIPVSYHEQNNVFEHEIVRHIYDIAQLITAIQDGNVEATNQQLSVVLRHPAWGIKPNELWQLAIHNRRRGDWLKSLQSSQSAHLINLADWFVWLSQTADRENLVVMIDYIIGLRPSTHLTSPLRAYFTESSVVSTDYLKGLSALRTLLSHVHEYSSHNKAGIKEFVSYMSASIENQAVLADESAFVTGDNAVELMTVHKAKGLEFDSVFVIDVIDKNWSPNRRGRKAPSNLPLQPAYDDIDDYIRLLYVAATRARHTLIFSSYTEQASGDEVLPSPLLTSAILPKQISAPEPAQAIEILEDSLEWPRLSHDDELQNLKSTLESFSLSATALLDFLDVSRGGPQTFLERHLLCLPSATSTAMAFGTAIHAALEYAQILTNRDKYSLVAILKHFDDTLIQTYLPKSDYIRFKQHGEELLTKLLGSDSFWLPKGSLPEQKISDVVISNARLSGKLDRIDNSKDGLTVIDYKTGNPLSSFNTKNQQLAVKAWRHRTQLVFYALLLSESARFSKAKNIKGQMVYVEAAQARELVREYQPSGEEILRMKNLIQVIWSKIQTLNLPVVTNYEESYSGISMFEEDLLAGLI